MAVTILEALQNAHHNVKSGRSVQVMIGESQLFNALTLLERGYPLTTEVETVISKYGGLRKVPQYEPEETPQAFARDFEHFCQCVNFGASALDARAIDFMNTAKSRVEKLAK